MIPDRHRPGVAVKAFRRGQSLNRMGTCGQRRAIEFHHADAFAETFRRESAKESRRSGGGQNV